MILRRQVLYLNVKFALDAFQQQGVVIMPSIVLHGVAHEVGVASLIERQNRGQFSLIFKSAPHSHGIFAKRQVGRQVDGGLACGV